MMQSRGLSALLLTICGGVLLIAGAMAASGPVSVRGLSGEVHAATVVPDVAAVRVVPEAWSTGVDLTSAQDTDTLCLEIHTGTIRAVYVISSPGGISGFVGRSLANFGQRVLSQSAVSLEVEVTSDRYLDTHAL